MYNKVIKILVLASIFIWSGCTKENITTADTSLPDKPVIEINTIKPTVGEAMVCGSLDIRTVSLASGGVFEINFNLKAREGLSQYKIDLHHNFDCHTHRKAARSGVAWKVLKIVDLDGQQQNIKEMLAVPANATAGIYHFMLMCIDKQGNESPFVSYTLKVSNSEDISLPTISMTSPISDNITIKKTDQVDIKLNIQDNKPLEDGRIELSYKDSKGEEFTLEQLYFTAKDNSSTTYEYLFSFPQFSATPGMYTLFIKVYDQVGNVAEKQISITLK